MEQQKIDCFYVYLHKKLDTGSIFYVGKGKGNRAFSKQGRNIYWKRVVDKYGYEVEFIVKNVDEKTAFDIEIKAISNIGIENICNSTFGGGGTSGWKHKEESKKKVSEKNKGKVRSKEFKEKRAELAKEMWQKNGYKEKMSEIMKNREFSDTHRKALSESCKGIKNFLGKKHTEETRKKQSESAKKRWAKNESN